MTIEQENAIKVVQNLIDLDKISGEEATTLILGIIKNDENKLFQPIVSPSTPPNTPHTTQPLIPEPIKIWYKDSTGMNEMQFNTTITENFSNKN